MAEDSELDIVNLAGEDLPSQLKHSDVAAGLYEGGGKTWECALDLAGVLAEDYGFLFEEDEGVEEIRIIEVRTHLRPEINPNTHNDILNSSTGPAQASQPSPS